VPRYGTIVRRLSRADLIELYELRDLLEPHAAAQAAGRLTDEARSQLELLTAEIETLAVEMRTSKRTVVDDADMRRLMSADLAFHLILLQRAGNRRLVSIVTNLRLLGQVFGTQRQLHDLDVVKEIGRQHRAVLKAVVAGDAEAARASMLEHLATSRRRAVDGFDAASSSRSGDALPPSVLKAIQKIENRHRRQCASSTKSRNA